MHFYAASVNANQVSLLLERGSEFPQVLLELFEWNRAEANLCLRTAGVERTVKSFVKPRCQLVKPIACEREFFEGRASLCALPHSLCILLHPRRSALKGEH